MQAKELEAVNGDPRAMEELYRLALASVYQADLPPAEQNWQMGLTRTLRILTRLMLPLALGVLAVYVFWFIPLNFSGAFEERNVLIVYNITIIAIIMLLCTTVSGEADDQQSVLYYAILTMAILTVVLQQLSASNQTH